MKNLMSTLTKMRANDMTSALLPTEAVAFSVAAPAVAAAPAFAMATASTRAAAPATIAISAYAAAGTTIAMETTVPAMHLKGLACSPCPVAKKQDRKNNWHGRPLIGRGGIG